MNQFLVVIASIFCLIIGSNGLTGLSVCFGQDSDRHRELLDRSMWLQQRGKLVEALTLAERALEFSRNETGLETVQAADDLEVVARIQMDLNRYDEAIANTKAVLGIRRQLQSEQPWTIRDAENRLTYLTAVRKLDAAGHQKLGTAAMLFDTASKLTSSNRLDEAIDKAQSGLELREKLIGYHDDEYLEQLSMQGMRYIRLNRDKGLRLLTAATEERKQLHGPVHRQYGSNLRALATIVRDTDPQQSEQYLATAADIYDRVLGKTHAETRRGWEMLATVQRQLAESSRENGRFNESADLFQREANTWKRLYDPLYWRVRQATANATTQLALDKLNPQQVTEFSSAVEQLSSVIDIAKNGRPQAALDELDRVEKVIKRLIEIENEFLLHIAATRANIRREQLDLPRAWEDLKVLLTRYLELLGPSHPDTRKLVDRLVEDCDQVAGEASSNEDFETAIEWHRRAVELLGQCDGPDSWRVKNVECKIKRLDRLSGCSPAQREKFSETFAMLDKAHKLVGTQNDGKDIELMNQALQARTDVLGPESREAAYCLNALGFANDTRGNFAEAETLYQSALKMRLSLLGARHPDVAESYHNVGAINMKVGDVKRAIGFLQKAADRRREMFGDSDPKYAESLTSLGVAYIEQGDGKSAVETLEEAVRILRLKGDEPTFALASALHNLASAYDRSGRGTLAEPLLQEASDLWKKLGLINQYAISLDNRAKFYEVRGEFELALPLRTEAVRYFRKIHGRMHRTTAIGLVNLATLHLHLNDVPSAERELRESLDAWFDDFQKAGFLRSESEMLSLLGRATSSLHCWVALARQQRIAPEIIWEQVVRWKGVVWRRERLLHSAIHQPAQQERMVEHSMLTRRMSRLMLMPDVSQSAETWRREFDELQMQQAKLDRQLARNVPNEKPVSLKEMFAALPQGVPLIDYLITAGFEFSGDSKQRWTLKRDLIAFVVRNGSVELRELGDSSVVEKTIVKWRTSLEKREPDSELNAVGFELRKLVWTPLEDLFGGAKLVLISPDGTLAQFPFAALPDERQAKYLIEDLAIVSVPVPQMLPELLQRPASENQFSAATPPSLLLVGGVNYDVEDASTVRHLQKLPGAAQEIQDVAQSYRSAFGNDPDPPLTGSDATEAALWKRAPEAKVILMATHGFQSALQLPTLLAAWESSTRGLAQIPVGVAGSLVDPFDPLTERRPPPGSQSVIALSGANAFPPQGGVDDGLLSAAEVAELPLSQTELVVLSACGTALGDFAPGEGTLGLQRAFQIAGARTTLATLWNVDDLAIRSQVTRLFDEMWTGRKEDPISRIEALRQAQLAAMRGTVSDRQKASGIDAAIRSPIRDWAAFVLSGDWR